jgi:hypothetical protein
MSPSTTAKGDAFELRVLDWIREEVAARRTLLNPDGAQFFHKRRYYSKKREADIIFDVAVEFCVPVAGKKLLSFLWLLECKDLGRPVGIDDVEEFWGKVRQIDSSEFQIKATILSSSGFTSGAFKFATNSGLSLGRLDPGAGEWILPRIASDAVGDDVATDAKLRGLLDEHHRYSEGPCYGVVGVTWCAGLPELLLAMLSEAVQTEVLAALGSTSSHADLVPFLGLEEIEARVEQSLGRLEESGLGERSLPAICDALGKANIEFDFEADLGTDANGRAILGRTTLAPNRIQISRGLETGTPRWRFTLAHELGHLALHRNLRVPDVRGHVQIDRRTWHPTLTALGRIEHQANQFASALLLPRARVLEIVEAHMVARDLRPKGGWALFVDDQPCNFRPYNDLLRALQAELEVSAQAAEIRLKEMGLLNDQRVAPAKAGDVLQRVLGRRS